MPNSFAAPPAPSIRPCVRHQGRFDVPGHGLVERGEISRACSRYERLHGYRLLGAGEGNRSERRGHLQMFAFAQNHRSFDHGTQFPHVARPGIAGQQTQIVGRGQNGGHAGPIGGPQGEMGSHGRDVLDPLADGGQAKRKDRQAIPEILAKGSGADHGLQIAMGGGNDAYIDRYRVLAANPLERAVLQDTQQADLGRGGQFAALVEKQGSAVRPLEPSLSIADGAGEAASLVAEKFGIDQFGRNRAAIDAEKRTARPARSIVNGSCDDFFARAGFAQDQHRSGRGSDQSDAFHDRPQAGIDADDRIGDVLPAQSREQRLFVSLGGLAQRAQLRAAAGHCPTRRRTARAAAPAFAGGGAGTCEAVGPPTAPIRSAHRPD